MPKLYTIQNTPSLTQPVIGNINSWFLNCLDNQPPPCNLWVLVTVKSSESPCVLLAIRQTHCDWTDYAGNDISHIVTHWTYLPSPAR